MVSFKKIILFVVVMLYSFGVYSESLGRTIHINRVFSEGTSKAGFYARNNISECKWGIMYIDLSNEAGKAIFSLALMAKTTDTPVVRVDYQVNESGLCKVNAIHVM